MPSIDILVGTIHFCKGHLEYEYYMDSKGDKVYNGFYNKYYPDGSIMFNATTKNNNWVKCTKYNKEGEQIESSYFIK